MKCGEGTLTFRIIHRSRKMRKENDLSIRTSQKAALFQESVIREMTRLFLARGDKPGVNLAQGFPDFPAPEAMKEAACRAIQADINQYAITWGAKSLRNAIAD